MKPITRHRLARALAAIDHATANIPTAGGSGRAATTPDPTGRLATTPDPAINALDQLTHLEQRIIHRARLGQPITRELDQLDDLLARWEPPTGYHHATLTAIAAGQGADGCASCHRIGRWAERHPGLATCQRCHRDLARIRAIDGHDNAEQVPMSVLAWRHANDGKPLSDDRLRNILRWNT